MVEPWLKNPVGRIPDLYDHVIDGWWRHEELEALGVNFINMLTSSFYSSRSQKRKKLLNLTVFFALLEPVHVKAARKILVNLNPVEDLVQRFRRVNVEARALDRLLASHLG